MAILSVTVNGIFSIRELLATSGLFGRETDHVIADLGRSLTDIPNVTHAWSKRYTLTGNTSTDLTALAGFSGETINMNAKLLYAAIFHCPTTNTRDVEIQDASHVTNPWTAIPNRNYVPGAWDLLCPFGENNTAVSATNKILYIDQGAGTGNPVFDVCFLFGDTP